MVPRGFVYILRVGVILIIAVLIATTLVAGVAPRSRTPALTSYVLAVGSTTGGNVTTPGVGNSTYYEGTVIYLVATPHPGYHFVDWSGNVSTISNVRRPVTSITINGSYSITANFEEDPPARYMLAVMSTPGGSIIIPGEGTFTYDAGTVVNLVATPVNGYEFSRWSGDVDTIANVDAASTTITVGGNRSYILICANFRESPGVCGGSR